MMDNFYQLGTDFQGRLTLFYKNLDYLAALHKVGYTVFDVPRMKLN